MNSRHNYTATDIEYVLNSTDLIEVQAKHLNVSLATIYYMRKQIKKYLPDAVFKLQAGHEGSVIDAIGRFKERL